MDLLLSKFLPSTLNDTLSLTNSKKSSHLTRLCCCVIADVGDTGTWSRDALLLCEELTFCVVVCVACSYVQGVE